MMNLFSATLAYILDFTFSDPQISFHPIRIIGKFCEKLEKFFRFIFSNHLKLAGLFTWIFCVGFTYVLNYYIIHFLSSYNIFLYFIFSCIMIYFCTCIASLKNEALKVVNYIIEDDIVKARKQLSFIVGRDTDNLNENDIMKAVIETVAENICDGVIAPVFYLSIGGLPLMIAYKVINTMDSMFGYKNKKYKDFGYFPAKLDDIFNFIPARLSSIFIIFSSFILKYDYKNSYRIYKRDRYNHTSPNSAHTEACVAGALNIMLGGDNYYFKKLVKKPTIGDNVNAIELSHIYKMNNILYVTSFLGYLFFVFINILKGVFIF